MFELPFLRRSSRSEVAPDGATQTSREISARLDRLPPDRAHWIACTGYVLCRAAFADLEVQQTELDRIQEILQQVGELSPEEAALVVEVASERSQQHGGTEDFLVTRELRGQTSREERLALLNWLFAVSAADGTVSLVEEETIRQITRELGLEHRDFTQSRSRVSRLRTVMRGLPQRKGES